MSEITQKNETEEWNSAAESAPLFVPKIGHGLIILTDLAEAYLCKGCSLASISFNHDIPVPDLVLAAQKLEAIGLIGKQTEAIDWFYLKEQPLDRDWVLKIVKVLKKHFH